MALVAPRYWGVVLVAAMCACNQSQPAESARWESAFAHEKTDLRQPVLPADVLRSLTDVAPWSPALRVTESVYIDGSGVGFWPDRPPLVPLERGRVPFEKLLGATARWIPTLIDNLNLYASDELTGRPHTIYVDGVTPYVTVLEVLASFRQADHWAVYLGVRSGLRVGGLRVAMTSADADVYITVNDQTLSMRMAVDGPNVASLAVEASGAFDREALGQLARKHLQTRPTSVAVAIVGKPDAPISVAIQIATALAADEIVFPDLMVVPFS